MVTIVGIAHSVSVTGDVALANGSPNSAAAASFSHAVNVRSPYSPNAAEHVVSSAYSPNASTTPGGNWQLHSFPPKNCMPNSPRIIARNMPSTMIHLIAGSAFIVQSTTMRSAGSRRTARSGRRIRSKRSDRSAVSVPASTPESSKIRESHAVKTMMKSSWFAVARKYPPKPSAAHWMHISIVNTTVNVTSMPKKASSALLPSAG